MKYLFLVTIVYFSSHLLPLTCLCPFFPTVVLVVRVPESHLIKIYWIGYKHSCLPPSFPSLFFTHTFFTNPRFSTDYILLNPCHSFNLISEHFWNHSNHLNQLYHNAFLYCRSRSRCRWCHGRCCHRDSYRVHHLLPRGHLHCARKPDLQHRHRMFT